MDLLDPPADGSTPLKNDRHERFCQLYAGQFFGNASKAYKESGYSPKTQNAADADSSRLVRHDKVYARVSFLRAEAMKQLPIDRMKILEIRLQCMNDIAASWTDRLRAAVDIEKSLGLVTDRLEVAIKAAPITIIKFEGMDSNSEQQ